MCIRDRELTFKVSSVAASASLVLQGKAITVATPDGMAKTDINLNDKMCIRDSA